MTDTNDAGYFCNAAYRGDVDSLHKLVGARFNINSNGYEKRTAIHVIASERQLSTVKCLIKEFNADQNVEDRWGSTPLDNTIYSEHEIVFTYLTSRGAARGKATQFVYEARILCEAGATGDVDRIRTLVQRKVNINLSDYDNRTALH